MRRSADVADWPTVFPALPVLSVSSNRWVCVVLWNSRYMDRALDALRAPRISRSETRTPRGRHGSCALTSAWTGNAFHLADFGGGHRPSRDPDASDA
ncbi:hypothetical protein [Nocardia sp. NPDC005998]|uniref:hypothetical protein n=1 Tax=Nocardia sp. NPDC005998 TaxID=3156894 RepID=UPI0033B6CC9F